MGEAALDVEVAWIDADAAVVRCVRLPAGACVADALAKVPEARVPAASVSVWGVAAAPDRPLRSGDRVELCPPLRVEPRKRRRDRAVNFRRGARS